MGGVVKSGLNFSLKKHFFLDVFFDSSYEAAYFSNTVNIGGYKPRLGLGYQF